MMHSFEEEDLKSKTLNRLREAESLIGSPTTEMFMDQVAPEHRLEWLRSTREILTAHGVKPENLSGRWHTK